MKDWKLCYAERPWAWFTTQSLSEQWGDGWDDVHYEHNAGEPYEPCWHNRPGYINSYRSYAKPGKLCKCPSCMKGWNEDGTPKWEIMKIAFEGAFSTPADMYNGLNSPWSVKQINAKNIAWLRPEKESGSPIFAGCSLDDFCAAILASGGEIYMPTNANESIVGIVTRLHVGTAALRAQIAKKDKENATLRSKLAEIETRTSDAVLARFDMLEARADVFSELLARITEIVTYGREIDYVPRKKRVEEAYKLYRNAITRALNLDFVLPDEADFENHDNAKEAATKLAHEIAVAAEECYSWINANGHELDETTRDFENLVGDKLARKAERSRHV